MKYSSLAVLLTILGNTSALAEIIILQGGNMGFQYGAPAMSSMSTIVISQPLHSPMLQRAHAWSGYQKGNNLSGYGLIVQPYTGTETETQATLNKNISRAQAFRLGN